MTAYSQVRNLRLEQLLEALQEPHSIKELATMVGQSYHTIRRDIEELQDAGKVTLAGGYKGRSIAYIAGAKRPLPMLGNKMTGTPSSITEYVRAWDKGGRTMAENAAAGFPELLIELLYYARQIADGNEISTKDLSNLRQRFTRGQMVLNAYASFFQQILAYKIMWDVRVMGQLAEDPDFPVDIQKLYEKVLLARQNRGM